MIELKWVVSPGKEKVLMYRTQQVYKSSTGVLGMAHWEWGDWKEVPTELSIDREMKQLDLNFGERDEETTSNGSGNVPAPGRTVT